MKGSSNADNNILDYGVVHWREQEPSIPSIEMVFAKLKALLRKAGKRSIAAVWNRIRSHLDNFSPAECMNYLQNAGYGPA